jgi:glycosyltransferase involved in cell wall biosynthesis
MIGQRGVPATYGGIERHVEELGVRLAERGHEVVVFCRTNYVGGQPDEYRGVKLRYSATLPTKHFEAFVHSGSSAFSALSHRFDVVHYHALGPGLFAPVSKAGGAAVVQTIHGLDHMREKWGKKSQAVLRLAGWMSARVPDATVVVSHALAEHYAEAYGRDTTYICNGVNAPTRRQPGNTLKELGLEPGRYALFVGRLVPEKAPDLLARAFAKYAGDERLVIVGGSSFTDGYVTEVQRAAAEDDRVVLAGYRYGAELEELYTNAGVFVNPSSLEGLPLTLLEAASYAVPVIASDIPPHVEVLRQAPGGFRIVPVGDVVALADAIADVFARRHETNAEALGLRDAVLGSYCWDRATDDLEALYRETVGMRRARRRRLAA